MKKQKKQNLLTAIIIILVLILIMMVTSIVYEEKIRMSKQEIDETVSSDIVEDNETVNDENDEISTEKVDENEVEEEKEQYVGEEEKENNTTEEVPVKSNDEKAIDLAKKEWGNDDSVTFTIEKKKDTKYYVAVKSEATVLQWYEINTETWEINEYY